MDDNSPINIADTPYSSFRQPSDNNRPKNPRRLFIIGFVNLFLIVIIVLGIFLFNKSQGNSKSQNVKKTTNTQKNLTTATESPIPNRNNGNNSIESSGKPSWFSNLSSLEQSFFNIPESNSSSDEKSKFTNLLRQNAQSAEEIILKKDCQPQPLAYTVGSSYEIKVKNEDNAQHTLRLGNQKRFIVKSGGIANIKFKDDQKGWVLGYKCDDWSAVGFLVFPYLK